MAVKRRSAQSPRPRAADADSSGLSSTRPSAASTPRSRSTICDASPNAAPPRRHSTTPTVRPRTSCRSQRARQAFRDIEFHPTILRDVSNVTAGWNVLGQPVVLPFAIAPTGFTRLMHTEGEIAGAAAAAKAGIPFSLSTLGTCAIEDLVTAVPQGRKWFQLYMWRDRERSMALVQRAADAGFRHPAGHCRCSGLRRAACATTATG